jgi:hypothetical protein
MRLDMPLTHFAPGCLVHTLVQFRLPSLPHVHLCQCQRNQLTFGVELGTVSSGLPDVAHNISCPTHYREALAVVIRHPTTLLGLTLSQNLNSQYIRAATYTSLSGLTNRACIKVMFLTELSAVESVRCRSLFIAATPVSTSGYSTYIHLVLCRTTSTTLSTQSVCRRKGTRLTYTLVLCRTTSTTLSTRSVCRRT